MACCANGAGRSAIARLCSNADLMPNSDAQLGITANLRRSGNKKPSDLEGFS